MAKKINIPEIYSLRKLSELTKIDYNKLYHAKVGTYNTLTDNELTSLFNVLQEQFEQAAFSLGFTPEGRRVKSKV